MQCIGRNLEIVKTTKHCTFFYVKSLIRSYVDLLQDDENGMLSYAFQVAMSLIQNRGFRNKVLRSLVDLYQNLKTPDYVNMCQCLIFLDDPLLVAEVLEKLSKDTEVRTYDRL